MMKKLNRVAMALILGIALGAQPMIVSAQVTAQSERAAHPRIVQAIQDMQEAMRELQSAPDDFGGNKAAAMQDAAKAIHSLKKALYWRLKMDDAAIDKLP